MDSGQVRGSGFVRRSLDSSCPRLDEVAPASGGICLDEVAPASSSFPILPHLSRFSPTTGDPAIAVSSADSAPAVSVSCLVIPSVPASAVSSPRKALLSLGLDGGVLDASSSPSTRGVSVPCAGVESHAPSSAAFGDGSVLPVVSSALHPSSATSRPLQGILPTPRSQIVPTSPVCPVKSHLHGQPTGSTSGSSVFSGAPVVHEPARQRPSSNFELSKNNFPPLLSRSADSDGPSRSSCPQSMSDLPSGTDAPTTCFAPASWASLVKDPPSNLQLKFIKPVSVSDDGKLKVKLPPAIAVKGASVWKDTLVGFFLDKLPISLVQSTANRLWGKLGLTDVLCNGNGFFFFKFSESGSLNLVLEGGPWYFGGRPIFLKLWVPGMNLSKDGCKRVPIWAHFYNVPLELWTDEGLSFIASTVGRPLHADSSTSSFKRLHYARICIEINIDDSLPNAFDLVLEDGSCLEIQIVYNWVPKKCSVCKDFGHLSRNCKKASHLVWIPKSAQPPVSPGDWQTVNNHLKDGLVKHSPSSIALLPHPAKAPSQPITQSGGLCCSSNIFDSLPSEDVPLTSSFVDNHSTVEQSSGDDGFPSNVSALPGASEHPVPPLLCSPPRHDRDTSLTGLSSPRSGSVISSPSSSPSASSMLANKLIMVDEVEKILGRKMKDKKKSRSSGNSRGKTSKSSK